MKYDSSFLAAQTYLRRYDKIGGYIPLLGMKTDAARVWGQLWKDVRHLDERSENEPVTSDANIRFGSYVLQMHPALSKEVKDLAKWPIIEASLYGAKRVHSISEYFQLMYYRAFLPVYICSIIILEGEPKSSLESLAMHIGYGAQLMDDTLDLRYDLTQGRIFVTREELDYLELSTHDLTTMEAQYKIARLRNIWSLFYYLNAFSVTRRFSRSNRNIARSWIEFGLRAILDGLIVPLPLEVIRDHSRYCKYFGEYMSLLDLPFLSEAWRYRILRRIVGRFVQTTTIVNIIEAKNMFEQNESILPEKFRVKFPHENSISFDFTDCCNLEDRRFLKFVHYGSLGIFPTLWDVARIVLGV